MANEHVGEYITEEGTTYSFSEDLQYINIQPEGFADIQLKVYDLMNIAAYTLQCVMTRIQESTDAN